MSVFLTILFLSIFSGVITKTIDPNTLPEMLPSPEKLSNGLGGKCNTNGDCSNVIGATCFKDVCQCTLPFEKGNGTDCVFGGVCLNSQECERDDTFNDILCHPRNSDCYSYNKTIEEDCNKQEKRCKCHLGFGFRGSDCEKLHKTCTPKTDDCKDVGVCVDKICQCVPPFHSIEEGKCEFGSNCTDNDNCNKIPRVICHESKCSCPEGMKFDALQCIQNPDTKSPEPKTGVAEKNTSVRSTRHFFFFITTTILTVLFVCF